MRSAHKRRVSRRVVHVVRGAHRDRVRHRRRRREGVGRRRRRELVVVLRLGVRPRVRVGVVRAGADFMVAPARGLLLAAPGGGVLAGARRRGRSHVGGVLAVRGVSAVGAGRWRASRARAIVRRDGGASASTARAPKEKEGKYASCIGGNKRSPEGKHTQQITQVR